VILQHPLDGLLHLLHRRVIGGRHRQIHPAQGLRGVVGHLGIHHKAVGHQDAPVVNGGQLGVHQADLLHRPPCLSNLHIVPHLKGFRPQDGQSPGQVGQAVLHRQGDRQTQNAHQGQQGAGVDAQGIRHHHEGNKPQQDIGHGPDEGVQALLHLAEAVQSPVQQFEQNGLDHQTDDQQQKGK